MIDCKLADAQLIDRQVGERLRRRRMLLGVTQDQLGAALGLSYQQIQKYETGGNRISAGRLAQIAGVLGVQPGWFFGAADSHEIASGPDRSVIDLVRHYGRIEDERVRAHLLALVRALADQAEGFGDGAGMNSPNGDAAAQGAPS